MTRTAEVFFNLSVSCLCVSYEDKQLEQRHQQTLRDTESETMNKTVYCRPRRHRSSSLKAV